MINVQQSANMLREATDIIISPGYGMAAAGAQIMVGQLADNLRRMGKKAISFDILGFFGTQYAAPFASRGPLPESCCQTPINR